MKILPSLNEIDLLIQECTKSTCSSELVFDLLNQYNYTTTVVQLCINSLEKEPLKNSRNKQISIHLLKYELMILNNKAIDIR